MGARGSITVYGYSELPKNGRAQAASCLSVIYQEVSHQRRSERERVTLSADVTADASFRKASPPGYHRLYVSHLGSLTPRPAWILGNET